MCKKLVFLISFILVLVFSGISFGEMIGHWTFDEGSGTTAYDSSGNGNDGTLEDDPTVVNGQLGLALAFEGSRVAIPASDSLTADLFQGSFTVSAWINAKRTGNTWQQIFRLVTATGSSNDTLFINTDGRLSWRGFVGGAWTVLCETAPGVVPANQWTHIAVTGDGTNFRIYVNGALSQQSAFQTTDGGNETYYIGGTAGGESYSGMIDDVRVYDQALTAAEIKSLAFRPKAYNPNPADGALLTNFPGGLLGTNLTWTKGDSAATHDVYFGTDYDQVKAGTEGTFQVNQSATYFVVGYGYTPNDPLPGGLVPGTTYYWRIDEVEEDGSTKYTGDIWSFSLPPVTARDPKPADGAEDVSADPVLSWTEGFGAIMYTPYIGESYEAVDNATGGTPQPGTSFTPEGPLEVGTTYYWRVDVGGAYGQFKGDIWSFTIVEGGTGRILREVWTGIGGTTIGDLTNSPRYPDDPDISEYITVFDGPVDWADNYGTRIHGWLYVPTSGDYTFWIAGDDYCNLYLSTDTNPVNKQLIAQVPGWTGYLAWTTYPEQQSSPISLVGGEKYFIEALHKEAGGGDSISVSWQGPASTTQSLIAGEFLCATPYDPVRAYAPNPGDGSTTAPPEPTLTWLAGKYAESHQLYFGTDYDAVTNATTSSPEYIGPKALGDESYAPGKLQLDGTYYWRVDEISSTHPDSPWEGNTWTFTTTNYLVVDAFEGYNVTDKQIWAIWHDGIGYWDLLGVFHPGNGTGSGVGDEDNDNTYMEETIVNVGSTMSMPYFFNNNDPAKLKYSEAKLTLSDQRDWTEQGVKSLSLWFYGDPNNVNVERMYVAVANSNDTTGTVYYETNDNIVTDATLISAWMEWNIDLNDFQEQGVNLADVNSIAIGFGTRGGTTPGGAGKMYFDDIRLYPARCVPGILKPATDLNDDCIVDYADIEILASNWLMNTYQVIPVDPGTTNLAGHWTFDNAANLGADSTGNNPGEINGNASQSANAKVGAGSLALDGDSDFLNVRGGDFFSALDDDGDGFTAAAWVQFDYRGEYSLMRVFSTNMSAGGSGGWGFGIIQPPARLRFTTYGIRDYDTGDLSSYLPESQWTHIAFVYKSDGDADFYIDGSWAETIAGNFSMNNTDGFLIGGLAAATATEWFEGLIDDLRIYSDELSQGEIGWLAGKTVPYAQELSLLLTPRNPAINAFDDDMVDLKDYALLAEQWLEEQLWPEP